MPNGKEIIIPPEISCPKIPDFFSPLQHKFFATVLQGRHAQPTQKEINTDIKSFFDYEPLTLISKEQQRQLTILGKKDSQNLYRRTIWKNLAGDVFLDSTSSNKTILLSGVVGLEYQRSTGVKPLTPNEKENLFTNPAFYGHIEYHHTSINRGGSDPLLSNGTRNLCDEQCPSSTNEIYDSYGYTIDIFNNMLSRVRMAQGKTPQDRLSGLDIGGSNGLAAHDAEQLDPNLDFTNTTIDPELGVWPLRGGHRLMYAEYLPKDYFEKFDVIISSMAFEYMRFRDIALENSIRALKKGGILCIHFGTGYSHNNNYQQTNNEIDLQFQRMKKMQEDGIINFTSITNHDINNVIRGWDKSKRTTNGYICLQKTESMANYST